MSSISIILLVINTHAINYCALNYGTQKGDKTVFDNCLGGFITLSHYESLILHSKSSK
jgi:hypothetical protein